MATRSEPERRASARPTGTVTFLFSDIEGSTARWERAYDAMARALARHDALMRETIAAHGGYVFKTVGDAFCAAFQSATQALEAALAAQRSLAAEDFADVGGLRVRMALHTGDCEERDGDYFGPTLNRVARLLSIGHGGQVLLSRASADILHANPPERCCLRDLGAHRLKDLARAERVYQLVAPDLPEAFPALRSLDYLSNNLPAQLTSFVGREGTLAEIKALVERHRLVTIVGAGGSGKTRCAIQAGAELLDGSGHGVWLAELAPIADATLVPHVIAHALNVHVSANRPPLDALLAYLKRKRLLLVIDNCEHVIAQARTVITAVLQQCPEVRILATSREALNIEGEQLYRVPSLAVPPAYQTVSPQEVLAFGAALLFADRAVAADRGFSVTDENAPFVAEICRRLDGIPLAIELAAARVKVLAPKQLARMLDERFRVLTGGNRSALPRQQTMRALIDWSYDLLSETERALFRKIAVFAGGFTLESACAVCGSQEMDELALLDVLSSLVDKSLLAAEPTEGGTRYRLLESTRQYARDRLIERGEYDAAASAHARAFLALAEELGAAWESLPDREWFARAEPEIENFRTALNWALTQRGDVMIGQRLAGALRQAWWSLAAAEGRRWVQTARELADDATPARVVARLELCEAELAASLVQYAASRAAAESALQRFRELDDALHVAYAQRSLGMALIFLGSVAEGEKLLVPALEQARKQNARRLAGVTLQTLADARHSAGDIAQARRLHSEALAILREVGAERAAANVCVNLAEAEFHGGNAEEALRLANEALEAHRGLSATRGVAFASINMTAYLIALERYDDARLSARTAIGAARDAQLEVGLGWVLQHLAAVAALRLCGDTDRENEDRLIAARLLGYTDARLSALQSLREYTEQREYDKTLAALREKLGWEMTEQLLREGNSWSEDRAVTEALRI